MDIKKMCKTAISKNELIKFLKGEGDYNIKSRDGLSHNYLSALVEGVYEVYKENNFVQTIYEENLNKMINSENIADLLHAYNYIRLQIYTESKSLASFQLSTNIYNELREQIILRENQLKQFKEIPEYGSRLENGAYQFISNMDNIMERDYGRKVL